MLVRNRNYITQPRWSNLTDFACKLFAFQREKNEIFNCKLVLLIYNQTLLTDQYFLVQNGDLIDLPVNVCRYLVWMITANACQPN